MERVVDLAAVGRIARRVEFKGIRLTEISANCDPRVLGPLAPDVDVTCFLGELSATGVEVICDYSFTVLSHEQRAASGALKYLLSYDLTGSDPVSNDDLTEFARSNGVLHSWPFVRELLFALTSRMGYPPYTLPVMHFVSKPATEEAHRAAEDSDAQ